MPAYIPLRKIETIAQSHSHANILQPIIPDSFMGVQRKSVERNRKEVAPISTTYKFMFAHSMFLFPF